MRQPLTLVWTRVAERGAEVLGYEEVDPGQMSTWDELFAAATLR
jgi:hypothetical protein